MCRTYHLYSIWMWLMLVSMSLVLVGCGSTGNTAGASAPVTESAQVSAVTPIVVEPTDTPRPSPINTSTESPRHTNTPTPEPTDTPISSSTNTPTESPSPTDPPTTQPPPTEEPAPVSNALSFAADVQPIFTERCIKCHSGDTPPRGLRLDNYDNIITGGSYRPVIIPENPDESELIKRIKGLSIPRMPFDGPPFLSDEKITLIEEWIVAGAPNN